MNVFTFWEGEMPSYIKLCLDTWKVPYILLNYRNLSSFTNLNIDLLKRFTLPQIADVVRVHVLRDNGGYWLDADTIMITDKLPKETITGNPVDRTNTIGFLHTIVNSDMFKAWANYQDQVLYDVSASQHWSVMGNAFTDPYLNQHPDISIYPVRNCWPETYMIKEDIPRVEKYKKFYFEESYSLSDLEPTNMLMLHNSWTLQKYKDLSSEGVLSKECTLSNILRSLL